MGNVNKGWGHDRQRHGVSPYGFWARNVGGGDSTYGYQKDDLPVGCPVIYMCDTRANSDLELGSAEFDTYIGVCRKFAGYGNDTESRAVAGVVQGTAIPYLGVGYIKFDGRISNLMLHGNCSNGDWLRIPNMVMPGADYIGLAQRAAANDGGLSHCFAIACKTVSGGLYDQHRIPAILVPWRQ